MTYVKKIQVLRHEYVPLKTILFRAHWKKLEGTLSRTIDKNAFPQGPLIIYYLLEQIVYWVPVHIKKRTTDLQYWLKRTIETHLKTHEK